VRVQIHFFTHGLNLHATHIKSGLDAGFIFHPWVYLKLENNPKESEQNSKAEDLTGTRPKTDSNFDANFHP
jgi:hypothetical protein